MDKSVSPFLKKKEESKVCTPLKKNNCNIQYGGIEKNEGDVSLIDSDKKDQSKCTRVYDILITLTIEPALFGFIFAYFMNMSVMTNMMMDKGCLYHLNYSTEVCNNLSHYDEENKIVEKLAANYGLYSNLTSFIAAFMMAFIAPWSDKYSRRIPLLMSIVGVFLTDIGYILCTHYFESRLEYLILARIPGEFCGGFICMLALVFSHASEVSSEKNRTLKYTSVELALGLGMSFGGLTGGFLYRYYGYFYVYVIVAAIHAFCFAWVMFIVEETTGLNVNMKWHEKAKDFFSCNSFKAGVKATCRVRQGKIRAILIMLIFSMCFIVLNYEAFGSIAFVYVHDAYNWDPTIYNIAITTSTFVGLLVTVIIVPILVRLLKFRDFSLGIIGTISMIAKNVFIAFSRYHTYLYYAGLCIGIFSSLSMLAVRAGISKLVDRDELGRVFAFLATCEATIPMLGTIAVTQIFNSTIKIFPNVPYTLAGCLLIVPLGTFIWALKITKNPYTALTVPANDPVKEKV